MSPKRPRKTTGRATFGTVTRLPSGRFRARYTLPDGSRHTAPKTFDSQRQARDYLTRVHGELLAGNTLTVSPTQTPFREYLATYLEHAANHLRPRTLDLYQRTAASWLLRPVGLTTRVDLAGLPLSALTPSLIRSWHTALLEHTRHDALAQRTRGASRRGGHPARLWARSIGLAVPATGRIPEGVLSAWTAAGSPDATAHANDTAGRTAAAGAYRLLRTVLGQAVHDGLLPSNPAHVKGAATAPHRERRPLAAADVDRLATAMPARYRAAVLAASWSGLRPGELFGLRRSDVDITASTLTVVRSLVEVPGKPATFGPPKSTAGRRTVNLPASIATALADHLAAFTGPDADALVFTTSTGKAVTASARSSLMRSARARIDRPDVTWHHLRHTGATLAAQAGATQAELQARIGHSTARAASIYQHAANDRDRALADRLDALMRTEDTPAPPDPTPPAGPTAPALAGTADDDLEHDDAPQDSAADLEVPAAARIDVPRTSQTAPTGTLYTTRRGHLAALA